MNHESYVYVDKACFEAKADKYAVTLSIGPAFHGVTIFLRGDTALDLIKVLQEAKGEGESKS